MGLLSPRSSSASGSSRVLPSSASKSSELLNTAQSDVDPDKLILSINKPQKDYREESLVVTVHCARVSRSFDGDMFAVMGSTGMVKIPAGTKLLTQLTPCIWVVRDSHDLVTILVHNGL